MSGTANQHQTKKGKKKRKCEIIVNVNLPSTGDAKYESNQARRERERERERERKKGKETGDRAREINRQAKWNSQGRAYCQPFFQCRNSCQRRSTVTARNCTDLYSTCKKMPTVCENTSLCIICQFVPPSSFFCSHVHKEEQGSCENSILASPAQQITPFFFFGL